MNEARDAVELPVVPPGKAAWVTLSGVGLLTLALVAAALMQGEASSLWALMLPPVVLGAIAALVRRRRVLIESDRLLVRAALYRREIALADVNLERSRVVDLRERIDFRPRLRTNGLAIPGFRAGNYRDREGRKTFCLVTAPRVLMLELHDGAHVLLSVEKPDAVLQLLRERQAAA